MASAEDWERLKREIGGDFSCDLRYDLVLHLRTAADGAEAFYTTSHARKESPEHALLLDQAILDAWTGHPSLTIVGNEQVEDSFKTKMDRSCQAALARFGLVDRCNESFRRVRYCFTPKNGNFIDDYHFSLIEYWLLPSTNAQMRLKRRTDRCSQIVIYTLTTRRPTSGDDNSLLETRRNLAVLDLHRERINEEPVRILRRTFVWENLQYKLDYFEHPRPGMILLEAYIPHDRTDDALPASLLPAGTFEDVTDDPFYSLNAIVQEIIHIN